MNLKNTCGWLLVCVCLTLVWVRNANADITLDSNGTATTLPGLHDRLYESLSKNKELQAAIDSYRRRNFAECEKLIIQARDLGEKLPSVQLVMARIAIELGAIPDAIGRIEIYLMESSEDPLAYMMLGEIALRTGRWTDAWLQFERCESLIASSKESVDEDTSTRLMALRGETAARRKQWTVAENLFKQWATKQPAAALPIWAQGQLSLAQGDLAAALEKFRAARAIDAKLPQPELTIANELVVSDPGNGCEKWFIDGLKASDASLGNWVAFSRWLLAKDRSVDVEKLLARAKEEFQQTRDIRFINALALRMLGKTNEAEVIFSALHQANADDLEAADQLALVLVESTDEGKRARAQQLSEATLRRAPNVENAVATAAWIQFKLGSIDIADRMLAELASKIAISPQSAYYVGQLLKARGREQDGNQVLEAAVKSPGIFVQRKAVETMLALTTNASKK